MKKLVRLWKRPSHDGQKYTYYLLYYDAGGRRKQKALGHADKRKGEKQCAQLARLQGRAETILAQRDAKLAAAREARKAQRQAS